MTLQQLQDNVLMLIVECFLSKKMSATAIIPAHLNSLRLPRKILLNIHGIPMIEHVRRRALMSNSISNVYVATCDTEIKEAIEYFGGKVIMTSRNHINGTSRVAEAVKDLNIDYVMLLQGDEPLIMPRHIDEIIRMVRSDNQVDVWNATGCLDSIDELTKSSFVKCEINDENEILNCFRKSPYKINFEEQKKFIKKILGIIVYKKKELIELSKSPGKLEINESIEQMRIIENGFRFKSIPISPTLPSINEPNELDVVLKYIQENSDQIDLLNRVLKGKIY